MLASEILETRPLRVIVVDSSEMHNHQGMDLLSERELEFVRSSAEGLTNREIGERLGLSRHTVKNYLFRVFDKVGVSSRMELLHLTMRQSAPQRTLQQEKTPASEIEICRKEAEDGSPEAQLTLAEMYSNGEGTARDYVVAYMWCLRSERALVDLRERVNAAKAQLFPLMNSEDILEAQHQASEWLGNRDDRCSALPPRPVAVERESAKFSTA